MNVCRFADLVVVVKRPTSSFGNTKFRDFRLFAKIRCARIISVLQYTPCGHQSNRSFAEFKEWTAALMITIKSPTSYKCYRQQLGQSRMRKHSDSEDLHQWSEKLPHTRISHDVLPICNTSYKSADSHGSLSAKKIKTRSWLTVMINPNI